MLSESDRLPPKIDDTDQKRDSQAILASAYDAVQRARHFDTARLAQNLTTYIHLLTQDEQYDRAQAFAKEVLQIDQNSPNAVEAILTLGICAAHTNHLDEAEQYFHQAADMSRRMNYPMGVAHALQYLTSLVLLFQGKFHIALTLMEEAGVLRDELGSKHWSEPFLRGLIYQIVGDRRHCRQVLDELVLQVEPGTRAAAAYYLLWARLAIDEEELEQAIESLRVGLRVANRIRVMDLNLWIRLEYSRYHRLKGEASVARSWAEDALHQAQAHDLLYFTGLALLERAQAHWDTGNQAAAEADLAQAFKVLESLEASFDLARAYFLKALWGHQSSRPEAANSWVQAIQYIIQNGYGFLLEKEQDVAFPLIAAYMRSKEPEVRSATENLLRHLASVPPPPLRVAALGQFAVWKGRRQIADQAWTKRKAGELFRYLLLQPNRAAGRDVIIEALWPEHTSDTPYDLLHQATSALRHALEPDLPDKFPSRYLKVEGEQIALVLPPGSVVDFEHFERALPLALQTRNIERLSEALKLYSGDLFPSDQYNDWSTEKRHALAELHQRGLLALGQSHLEQGQYFNAINCCRQVLHSDSWNEEAVLIAMRAYAGLQDAPHALGMYKELETTLKNDLDIKPRSDLRSFAEQLRKS